MILGRGAAATDEAIVAEYERFLAGAGHLTPAVRANVLAAPGVMRRRLGAAVADWADADVLALCARRRKSTTFYYAAFLAFLLFRGYRRTSLDFLDALPFQLARLHRPALEPHRRRIEETARQLGYGSTHGTGSVLRLLIWLLAVVRKPLDELTRADFTAFAAAHQARYRAAGRRGGGEPDANLSRLEFYLVHWGALPPRQRVLRHEEHFARLRHAPIRAAIVAYMAWCTALYRPSTIDGYRAALLAFFGWLQEREPAAARLDAVTRPVALAYAAHLKEQRDAGRLSLVYSTDRYAGVRRFFAFAVAEGLETAPVRNPFGTRDVPRKPDMVPRYLSDREVRAILAECERGASLRERTLVLVLLHTGIRAAELAALKATDLVQIQGVWKLHVHQGKGLKDRLIPLTAPCLAALRAWQEAGWGRAAEHLFTWHGRPWRSGCPVSKAISQLGRRLGIADLTPHRFRHTFAVALLNYGIRESALQKLMGHATLGMTLEYARILDASVEHAFNHAVEQMQTGPLGWVPSFFGQEEYTLFAEGDAVSFIRLPHGYCRRNPKLHCESDVKCLLCERYTTTPADLPRLREMRERFMALGLELKAQVVDAQIRRVEDRGGAAVIPLRLVATAPGHGTPGPARIADQLGQQGGPPTMTPR